MYVSRVFGLMATERNRECMLGVYEYTYVRRGRLDGGSPRWVAEELIRLGV